LDSKWAKRLVGGLVLLDLFFDSEDALPPCDCWRLDPPELDPPVAVLETEDVEVEVLFPPPPLSTPLN